ncbi:MAG: c-type cytochrome [Verrucomicrobiota bacterium JB023]|nr:c-type cytochrome [Verrucomicrobiota bacterium JB023]
MQFFYAFLATTLAAFAVDESPSKPRLLQAFEGDGFGDWQAEGQAFGLGPAVDGPASLKGKIQGYARESFASSAHGGPKSTGSLISPEITIDRPYLSLLIGGAKEEVAFEILREGEIVLRETGQGDSLLRPRTLDVGNLAGEKVTLRLRDDSAEGFLLVDHIQLHTNPNAAFPAATREGKPFEPGLKSSPTLPGLTLPAGIQATIHSDQNSHGVVSPTALSIAENGDLYVTETHRFRFGIEDNRDRLFWVLDDIASQTTDDRRELHEKWKDRVPIEKLTAKSERIRLLIDHDGDGRADESKVFAEGFDDLLDGTAAGILAFEGTVYFACIPHIWALSDDDGDGVADERTSLQEGFGVRVSLSGHDLNGFTLGPDGRIYGSVGDRGLNLTTKEGLQYILPQQGAAFRFDPDGSNFEIFHLGLRNPKEIAFNEVGDAFSVDNNADMGDKARLVYLVDGGDSGWRTDHQVMHTFHRQIGLEKRPPNVWMGERWWDTENDEQPAWLLPPISHLTNGPSGLTYQPGTALGGEHEGRFFICDYKGGPAASGIWSFGTETDGAGYRITEPRKFLWGLGATDIEFGYDGRAYITDFVTGWSSSNKGRVISLETSSPHEKAEEVAQLMDEGFQERDDDELAELIGHEDFRIRLRAQYELARRPTGLGIFATLLAPQENGADASLLPSLDDQVVGVPLSQNLLPGDNEALTYPRLHALWGLWMISRLERDERAASLLVASLKDPSAELRAQAARALGEAPLTDGSSLLEALADPSARVRFHAALALGRQRIPQAFEPLLGLAIKAGKANDRYLLHAAVVGLSGCSNPTELTSLSSHALPSARMAALLALRRLGDPGVANFLFDLDPRIQAEAIRSIHDGPIEAARPALAAVADQVLQGGKNKLPSLVFRRLIHSLFRLGTAENAKRLMTVALDENVALPIRREALRLLEQWTSPHPVDQSLGRYAPLRPRPKSEIEPLIARDLAPLLAGESRLTSEAIALVTSYGILPESLSTRQVIDLVKNKKLGEQARKLGLDLLLQQQPDGLPALVQSLFEDTSQPAGLRLAALEHLAQSSPAEALPALKEGLKSDQLTLRRGAISLLAGSPSPQAAEWLIDRLELFTRGDGDPRILLELLTSAQARDEPAVQIALENYQLSLPPNDPLAPFYPALAGGDPAHGKSLFETHPAAQCARCHAVDPKADAANMAGPHLAGIGQQSHRYLLEALIRPSDTIASGFAPLTIKLTNDEILSGTLLERTADHVDLLVEGEALRIKTQDIANTSDPTSPMPPMGPLLASSEIRDLVAYLNTLKVEPAIKKPLAQDPKPYHPFPAPEKEEMAEETTTPAPAEADAANAAGGIPEGIDSDFWEVGKTAYATCTACHQANGAGVPGAFPPLAGSEWVTGPVENLIRMQLRGLQGEIEVKGETYNNIMPPMAYQTDEQIAAVLTYVRNSFGNSASPVSPDEVAALRDEAGQPMLTVADLKDPAEAEPEPAAKQGPTELKSAIGPDVKMPKGESDFEFPMPLFAIVFLVLIGLTTVKMILGKS